MPPTDSPTGRRKVVAGGPRYRFPDPIGDRRLVLLSPGMIYAEEELDEHLDRINRRISDGRGPVDPRTGERVVDELASIWDGLPFLWDRYPMPTVTALLVAALESDEQGGRTARVRAAADLVDRLSPGEILEEALAHAIMDAVNVAFGRDVDEAAPADPPMAPPPVAVGASVSGGTNSSRSGPPRSRPVG